MSKRVYSSRVQWQGKSWQLRVVDQVLADGATAEKGVIDHPGSVVIVPLDGEQVLMLRQYRLSLDQWILELPAGTREGDEPWQSCAQRELREETGYQASEWTELGRVWPAPGITNELMAVYLACDLSPAPLPGDADEEIEVRPMPLDELVALALDGRLQDAKSVVGVLRAAKNLNRLPPKHSG
ncbi:MAG: NUDIX hydrolase [Chloroflexota bacterium]|nr:MAG: NUDIX hydrolase [Chloroflexota bacterium]